MSKRRRQAPASFLIALACVFWILSGTAGYVSTGSECCLEMPGLKYRLQELSEPRLNRVHILRVDLADKNIQPGVVVATDPDGEGPAEAVLTDPFKLADGGSVIAFINANPWDGLPDETGKPDRRWFEGQPVVIDGLAVSGGRLRSPAGKGNTSIWFDERGRMCFGAVREDIIVTEGMAGFQQIVKAGSIMVSSGGSRHPRTAIGADRSGRVMWLVVVDGRQVGYSEGMTLHELGGVMLDLGCWNATNMDGGGSSIMGLADDDGVLGLVNRPSERHLGVLPGIRPLPMILTIKRMPGKRSD